eukprot:3257328-Amphidinium_carterae.2
MGSKAKGFIVKDCKGAAVVANKLQAGARRPRGRHICAAIGDIQVQWMRGHLAAGAAGRVAHRQSEGGLTDLCRGPGGTGTAILLLTHFRQSAGKSRCAECSVPFSSAARAKVPPARGLSEGELRVDDRRPFRSQKVTMQPEEVPPVSLDQFFEDVARHFGDYTGRELVIAGDTASTA